MENKPRKSKGSFRRLGDPLLPNVNEGTIILDANTFGAVLAWLDTELGLEAVIGMKRLHNTKRPW
jgi:hypothetical protein